MNLASSKIALNRNRKKEDKDEKRKKKKKEGGGIISKLFSSFKRDKKDFKEDN